jgi:hypothetical protein
MTARAERVFVNMAKVRVVARTMSRMTAAMNQPVGCRVSVPANAIWTRNAYLALVFVMSGGFDRADS